MRGESASAARAAAAAGHGALLDALPASVVIVEPGSARVLFANRAALELTGEEAGRPAPPPSGCRPSACRDAEGRPLADEALPSVRAARGERVRGTMVTCRHPARRAHAARDPQTVTAPDGEPRRCS